MSGVGTLLAERRKAKEMTQDDVAERLGMSRSNYSHMETTRSRLGTMASLSLACDVLDIDPLEMVLALGFKVRLPDGVRDQDEVRLLERWRTLPPETKAFLRQGLGL
jgi:transcriptional regulator with XRE-family HTH domain